MVSKSLTTIPVFPGEVRTRLLIRRLLTLDLAVAPTCCYESCPGGCPAGEDISCLNFLLKGSNLKFVVNPINFPPFGYTGRPLNPLIPKTIGIEGPQNTGTFDFLFQR
ncbi:hypothetical protein AVEN_177891-1 [Araneus ventricosus]|uniref:Uncharacterized protein n=1 Tax=Araneus ventricosus TaxID=182803 RepID=A0A4Y2LE91_ARAVE|nr:hypothetical protein AVEN_177891-1 [Araneus ventricosus]